MAKSKKSIEGTAIVGLIINLFIPGLGTIVSGRYDIGIAQLVLALVGVFLLPTVMGTAIGILILIGVWVWALVSGIKILKETKK